jgi:hypothetical protein
MSGARLPPYAGAIAEARRAWLVPAREEVRVAVDFWLKPAAGREVVVLPAGESPESFAWWFLRQIDVLIWWYSSKTEGARLLALVRAVLAADPRRLIAVDRTPGVPRPLQFFKTVAGGVEVPA